MSDPDPQPNPPPTLRDHLRNGRNAVGLGLMVAGVICLVALHFMDFDGDQGWEVWPE